MCRQFTPTTLCTVRVGRLDTPLTLGTVDIGTTILASADPTEVTVSVLFADPHPAHVTQPVPLLAGQLQQLQGDGGEQPHWATLLPCTRTTISLTKLFMVGICHPVITHHQVTPQVLQLSLHEVGEHPYCRYGGTDVEHLNLSNDAIQGMAYQLSLGSKRRIENN